MTMSLLLVRDEVLRQIDLTSLVLQRIATTSSGKGTNAPLLQDEDKTAARNFDAGEVKRLLRQLADERHKAKHLEYHVLFTGTMKAGKSTSVNAVVGVDLMPTRAEAMTALPTLIKHTPERDSPVLTLRTVVAVNAFLGRLAATPLNESQLDTGARTSYAELRGGRMLPGPSVEGVAQIQQALTLLNDALRIAECAGLGDEMLSIFDASLEDLPTVEVAFSNVSGVVRAADHGRLVLVDSPGPNEANFAGRLRGIVEAQIDRSSAIVLVRNYTTQGANDDEEMRKLVDTFLKGRDTVHNMLLVNRYDDARAGDPDIDAIRDDVVRKFPSIARENVFAVSALNAALATFVGRDLERAGGVTDAQRRTDFAKRAWATDYDEEDPTFNDATRWRAKVPAVWRLGFFDCVPKSSTKARDPRPGEATVVSRFREAADRAAIHSMTATALTLGNINRETSAFLGIRSQLFDEELAKLQKAIDDLDKTQRGVEAARARVDLRLKKECREAAESVAEHAKHWAEYVDTEIDRAFSEASRRSAEEMDPTRRSLVERLLSWSGLKSSAKPKDLPTIGAIGAPILAQERESEIVLWDAADEQRFQKEIAEKVNRFSLAVAVRLAEEDALQVEALKASVVKMVESELRVTLEAAQATLGEPFKAELTTPSLSEEEFKKVAISETARRAKAGSVQVATIKYEDRPGAGGAVLRFLADVADEFTTSPTRWGKDPKAVMVSRPALSRSDLKQVHLTALKQFQRNLQAKMLRYMRGTVSPRVKAHFNDVTAYLERYRNVINHTLRDHTLSFEERAALRSKVLALREMTRELQRDVALTQTWLRETEAHP